MKTISIAEFETLVARNDCVCQVVHGISHNGRHFCQAVWSMALISFMLDLAATKLPRP